MPAFLAMMLFLLLLSGCEVPTPPPELPTATPGSSSPDSPIGTPERRLPDKGYTPIASAPGNIFFVRSSGLWRISPDGTGETKLAGMVITNPPQPSPDGSMVAFTTASDLYVVPASGGEPRKLASGLIADHQRIGWTPDSSTVGYIAFDAATMGQETAWAVSTHEAGSKPVLLTTLTDAAVAPGPVYERSVQWSPEDVLVIVSGVNNPFRLLHWPLSAAGASDARDIPGGEPDWSPDGRTIIYAETLSGALLIYGVIEDGATPFRNELHYVGTGLGEYAEGPGPRFSPVSTGADSDLIAYRSHTNQGEPQVDIRLRSKGDLEPLPAFTNNPAWSPGGDRLVVETGSLKQAPLGPKWTSTGLSIAKLSLAPGQPHRIFPLVKDAMWPAWGK